MLSMTPSMIVTMCRPLFNKRTLNKLQIQHPLLRSAMPKPARAPEPGSASQNRNPSRSGPSDRIPPSPPAPDLAAARTATGTSMPKNAAQVDHKFVRRDAAMTPSIPARGTISSATHPRPDRGAPVPISSGLVSKTACHGFSGRAENCRFTPGTPMSRKSVPRCSICSSPHAEQIANAMACGARTDGFRGRSECRQRRWSGIRRTFRQTCSPARPRRAKTQSCGRSTSR